MRGDLRGSPRALKVHTAVPVPTSELNKEVRILVYNGIATEQREGHGGEESARADQEPLEVEKEASCPEMRGIKQQSPDQNLVSSPAEMRPGGGQ